VRVLALAIGCLLLAAPGAAAADPQPLPEGAYALPYDGYRHPVSAWPAATNFEMFDFTVYADFDEGEFEVKVATSPDADADGELADVVASYVAGPDPRAPEVFTARTTVDSPWLAALGTYYWQAYYTDELTGTVYETKLQTITIVERPPPDPPSDPEPTPPTPAASTSTGASAKPPATAARLTHTIARTILQRTIRSQTHRSAQELATSCSLPSATSARCGVSWRDARYGYRASAKLTSTTTGVVVKLDGTRTRRSCSVRPCSRAIHWSVATT
jgi:hypothetical protein